MGVSLLESLPGDGCLLANQEASQLAGAAVTGHPQPISSSRIKACQYYGGGGSGDHPVSLSVTAYADVANAHLAIQSFIDVGGKIGAAPTRISLGDEAIIYKLGSAVGAQVRRGAIGFTVLVQSGATPDAMQRAARIIFGRLFPA